MDGDGPPLVAERLRSAMGAPLLLRRPVRDAVVVSFDDYQALLCASHPHTPSTPANTHATGLRGVKTRRGMSGVAGGGAAMRQRSRL
jgi:hypothetical protein